MNPLLNGTACGELDSCEQELLVPEFMTPEYITQSVVIPYSAYEARAAGRVKRKVRKGQKYRRDFKNGIAYVGLMFGLLVLANLMVELICR